MIFDGSSLTMIPAPPGAKAGDVVQLDNGAGFESVKVTHVEGRSMYVRRAGSWPVAICRVAAWTIIGGFVLLLVACGGGGAPVRPDEPPRLSTTTVSVPKTTKCLKRADLPILPAPTPVDVVGGTTEQLAASAAADAESYKLYAEAAAAQMAQCVEE